MALITYPLNDITYSAEDAELWLCTRNSGVWTNNSFQITNLGNNQIQIGTGIAWIRNQEFAGKVAALKVPETVPMGISNGTYPRIDVIALRFSVNDNETTVVLKQGTPASNPVRPAITRTGDIYELYLASVYRPAGATSITAANITDLRLDSSVCGLMADSVTQIDTTAINNQVTALINNLQAEINGVQSQADVMLKSEWTSNGIISGTKGGTGKSLAEIPNGAILAKPNDGSNHVGSYSLLPISKGGTGKTTAAAALAALGGTSIDLLWQNASPLSAFPAQTINVANLSDYDMYMIVYGVTITEGSSMSTIASIGYGTYLIGNLPTPDSGGNVVAGRRYITYEGTDELVFRNGGYGKTENSNYFVPIKIYGIKL